MNPASCTTPHREPIPESSKPPMEDEIQLFSSWCISHHPALLKFQALYFKLSLITDLFATDLIDRLFLPVAPG